MYSTKAPFNEEEIVDAIVDDELPWVAVSCDRRSLKWDASHQTLFLKVLINELLHWIRKNSNGLSTLIGDLFLDPYVKLFFMV